MTDRSAEPIQVETDDPEVRATLLRLAQRVVDAGGCFLPGVCVRAVDGDLAVRRTGTADRQDRLLSVPYSCMPDVNAFQVRLENGRMVGEPKQQATESPTELQRQIFDDMLAVYNLLDKPNRWARQCPLLTLWHDPDLLEHLLDPANISTAKSKLGTYRQGRWDALVIQTFLQSRVFNLKRGEKDGGGGAEKNAGARSGEQVLMPIIDFLNHDLRARGFQIAKGDHPDQNQLYVYQDRPVAGSDECFVVYSNMDRYTSFVNYGFADESAPFLVSQGAAISLSQGLTLNVGRNIAGTFKGKLPEKVRDLRIFMPRVQSPDADTLNVSRLLIPGENAPKALRRVLTVLLRSKRKNWTDAQLNAAVLEAERKLLVRNHRFYDRAAELLAASRARSNMDDVFGRLQTLHEIEQMLVRLKRHLYDYADRLGVDV